MAVHPLWVRRWLTEDELDAVSRAIAAVERRTSSEVRVHLDRRCPSEPMARATEMFELLGMTETRDRNAVLTYLSLDDHYLAVIGDRNIHDRMGQPYWEELAGVLRSHLVRGCPGDGLLAVLERLGLDLAQHFPRRSDDTDELPNQVTFGHG
jgi:uncharacterized membrane protein